MIPILQMKKLRNGVVTLQITHLGDLQKQE